ncbi:GTA-gp10 family protein [Novosphingobium sp. RL4]|uniref:GTA-gp10 family protein n=1 Tax=Novosphingobium sp. RL4 TaxID=3109595 RepID=UPI002D778E49|nr:GTA-gp10 family protein [Novosphingobium sp. RL4]WRT95895.1 GTA-gp10 family protein [Novosphingobium sp. RL4]
MPDTRVELDFADGRYSFWLALPHVIELERKCGGKSVFAMYDAMGAGLGTAGDDPVYLGVGTAMVTEIRETIRLGLIGGNSGFIDGAEIEIGPNGARNLVDAYTFPARPLIEGLHIAWTILHAAIVGIDLKKADGAGEKPPAP